MAALENDLGAPTPLPSRSLPKAISGATMALPTPPRALLFDVFGTCVDWRTTVTQALDAASHAALNSATASLASRVRLRASDMSPAHWGKFAQEWRDGYKAFTRRLAADPNLPWKTIDEHHLESLKVLLSEWELDGLWTDDEVRALSLVWHRLDPWADCAPGIALLSQMFCMFTLLRTCLEAPVLCAVFPSLRGTDLY
jgi:2-haloacid dehalogenase